MNYDIFSDVLAVLSRAHYGFWLRDPKKRDHNVPAKLLAVVMFLTIALMTIFGRGTSAAASAIYTVFFIASLCLTVFVVLLRTCRVRPAQVAILIESYVVALFLTLILLFHNMIFPILFFSIDTDPNRDSAVYQLAISFIYSLPGAIFLGIRSDQFARERVRLSTRDFIESKHVKRLRRFRSGLRFEMFLWSILHYGIVAVLLWVAVFAPEGRLNLLNEAVKKIY